METKPEYKDLKYQINRSDGKFVDILAIWNLAAFREGVSTN